MTAHPPAQVIVDRDALVANWRALDRMSGNAVAGAAIKADGYGVGAVETLRALQSAGCRDFFVATWAEAAECEAYLARESALSVLNGVREADMARATTSRARPVLNTTEQMRRWRPTGKPCDLMLDTGMNRLGISEGDLEAASELNVVTAMSHLASADEDSPQNKRQLAGFERMVADVPARRKSLSNSAGIALGPAYHFDLTRPGLALYGGIARSELETAIRPVVSLEANVLQVRNITPGDAVGYNAVYRAQRPHPVGIVSIGYADGFARSFAGSNEWRHDGRPLPVIGRVSMDLVALDLTAAPELREGEPVRCAYDLRANARLTGLSQYELLTNLGARLPRRWE